MFTGGKTRIFILVALLALCSTGFFEPLLILTCMATATTYTGFSMAARCPMLAYVGVLLGFVCKIDLLRAACGCMFG